MASGRADLLRLARIYDEPRPTDGRRILIDALWPRGISKERARLDDWCKAIAPSAELRHWYAHDPDRAEEFFLRYRAELREGERATALERIEAALALGTVTLLTATKDLALSHGVVIRNALTDLE